MKCPRCQAENPSGTRFCGQCAAPLASVCPSCGASNPPENKFCGQCAAPLDKPAQPRFAAPESYTPKHLVEKILTSRTALEGERKQVTVLFVDVSGFTSLSERVDPSPLVREVERFTRPTAWTDTLLEVAADADLFICGVYTLDIPQRGLLNYRTLQERRHQLTCKRLVLTHIGAQMQNRLAEVTEEVASDGRVITL